MKTNHTNKTNVCISYQNFKYCEILLDRVCHTEWRYLIHKSNIGISWNVK